MSLLFVSTKELTEFLGSTHFRLQLHPSQREEGYGHAATVGGMIG